MLTAVHQAGFYGYRLGTQQVLKLLQGPPERRVGSRSRFWLDCRQIRPLFDRIERRTTRIWDLPPCIGTEDWHDHFCALIEIHRHTEVFDTRQQDWVLRQETAYSLSTVTLSAADAAQAIRAHWGIENRLHYVRDVTLGEGASRIRCNPGLFALLRSFALNLLRFNGVTNVSLALYDNALNFDKLLDYQGL